MYVSPNPDLSGAKEWLRRTEKALTEAKKDNDFIYHERIPEEKSFTVDNDCWNLKTLQLL